MMDSGTTVASLKEKLQETTGIKVGWQVLLLGAPPGQPKRKQVGFGRKTCLVLFVVGLVEVKKI